MTEAAVQTDREDEASPKAVDLSNASEDGADVALPENEESLHPDADENDGKEIDGKDLFDALVEEAKAYDPNSKN